MSDQYDVIVVGAGGSGLAAAISVARHGGRAMVLERQPQPGGTTGIAVGSLTAAGTSLQRAASIDDCAADHAEDASQFAPASIEASVLAMTAAATSSERQNIRVDCSRDMATPVSAR